MNLNKVFVLGRVTANPELRKTPGGQSVTSFSIATNRVWSDKGGAKQEETEFHNVVVWGRQAEIATQFLTKGSLALIEGRLKTRTWQDKNGANHRATEIISERIQLGPRPAGGGQAGGSSFGQSKDSIPAIEEIPVITIEEDEAAIKSEDLPF